MINDQSISYVCQEPIIRSSHLPYLPSESTLSRIFLFLEAPPTGFFAGVYIIFSAARKYFNNGEKRGKFNIFFRVLCENQRAGN